MLSLDLNNLPGEIPVSFDYKGKVYKGHLSHVKGAGGKTWFLMIDKCFCGQLFWSESFGFQFKSQAGQFEELKDYFEGVVVGWYG